MILNTGYTHIHGPEVNTRAVVSQKVRLFSFNSTPETQTSDFQQIGVMSSFSVDESRGVEPVRGIGFGDRIAELVPGVTDAASISVSRVALWLSNLFQVFGYKGGVDGIVRSLRHHRWPFDIRQELVFSEIAATPTVIGSPAKTVGTVNSVAAAGDATSRSTDVGGGVDAEFDKTRPILLTIYEGCWMTSYGTSFSADSALVTENCGISVSDITALNPDPKEYFKEQSNKGIAYRVKPA